MNNARRPLSKRQRRRSMTHKLTRSLVVAAACLNAIMLALPAPSNGVLELFNRLPEAPATAEEAARWIDKDGHLLNPQLLALKADIEAHRRAVAAPLQAQVPVQQAQAMQQQADLAKGMAN